ncbi:glycosyltransferase [Arcicella rosea]|uniref:Glycosyltransferase involved in cell wall biosynthesis n=1 Tax=Arcicella rosea TaxID=502909 RepID=A0A841EMQ1_9BACT|nr:glycosyltransferase [Arcicella rosea]MBB6004495.1 glycosyltransferase involved in cell wall biosynthesis [Arcicella rosea]
MKILNIGGYSWDIGGPPKIIYDHAVEQIKLGAEVTILTPITEGQKLYALPEGAKIVVCKRHWLAKFWAEFSPELFFWIKKHGKEYDVIHIHGLWHFAGLAPYLAGVKTPKCVTIHGLLDRWALANGYWKKKLFGVLFQKSVLDKTELIQINNLDEQNDLQNFLGHAHPNVKIIPNGMNIRNFEKLPEKGTFKEKYNIPKDKKLILFLSRINIKKGLDLLLPAFKTIIGKRSDCILVLAGPDDGYLSETERFIETESLQKSIKLVGMLVGEDKLAAFADADIFVLPSHSEGFSIATLEALVTGIPSLLSDRVGFGESIRESNAAHLVELNSESIVNGLTKMLDDEKYCELLANNGKALVKEKYDIELVAKNLFEEFKKIAK